MHQDATWYGGRPQPRRLCVRPSALPEKEAEPPQFSAHVYCGQMAGWIKMSLGTELGIGPGGIVLDGYQLPHPWKVAQQPSLYGPICSGIVTHLSNC